MGFPSSPLLFQMSLPICVQDAMGGACLVDGQCGERENAFPTRPPVPKSILATLILSCLEHVYKLAYWEEGMVRSKVILMSPTLGENHESIVCLFHV